MRDYELGNVVRRSQLGMKRLSMIFAFLLVVLAGNSQEKKQLVILHTNDTHSTILPLKSTFEDSIMAGKGGVVRRTNLINEERRKTPDLLLFDSGDFSQGSPFYTMFKGDVEVGVMNAMGYDATTLGNHEFDNGLDNLARLARMAKFPMVCSNYDFTGSVLEGLIKPWIILERNGVKIGVFGLTPKLEGIVMENAINGVRYIDPIKATQQTADYLRNVEKCDLIICLSHTGWDLWPKYIDDNHVFAATRNVDLILGGHSHTFMEHLEYVTDIDSNKVPVDQNGNLVVYVGKLTLNLEQIYSK